MKKKTKLKKLKNLLKILGEISKNHSSNKKYLLKLKKKKLLKIMKIKMIYKKKIIKIQN